MTNMIFKAGSPVQMELYGPSKCTKLTRPKGQWSNDPAMLCQFGPSKWATVQWTAYVMSIWTVQMDDGQMDRLYYINLDRPNGQQSNEPSMLRQYRLYYSNLDGP